MEPNITCYLKAAQKLKIPLVSYPEFCSIEIKLGAKRYTFRGGHTPFNDTGTNGLIGNKYCFNRIMTAAGFPVAKAIAVSRQNYINGQWHLPPINYPVVAKPTVNGYYGIDVFCNIQDEKTLIEYLEEHVDKRGFISIEAFHGGLTAYRVLVFFNKVIGVLRRDPAAVVGDGIHTLTQLIEIENEKRKRNLSVTMGPFIVDKECLTRLRELNLTLDYVPKTEEKVVLCYVCNAKRGGSMTDMGTSICPENAKLVIAAANALNLNIVGFDILCEDIMRPMSGSAIFVEANCNPDISIHERPLKGSHNPVGVIIMRRLIRWHPFSYAFSYLRQWFARGGIFLRFIILIAGLFGVIKLIQFLA